MHAEVQKKDGDEGMNKVNPKAQVGCFILLAIVILLVSYLTVKSLNPLAVYASDNILAKIIVTVLALLLTASLLQTLSVYVMRKSVEIGAGKPAEDVICPGCGHPLIDFISSHGLPLQCPNCKKLWHNGPACYNKGMPHASITIPTYPCPHCRSAASHDQDLFDDESFTHLT
jgi:hypothetical protein